MASENEAVATPEVENKLDLDVQVEKTGDCTRHVVVTIPEADVNRYFQKQYDDLLPRAEVPGFRPGKAPRKLIEAKFRKSVADQVKGSLLMDSLTQISDEELFSAIGEPDFDFDAVEVDPSKELQFEFNIEVRPEFDLPKWKGLNLERPEHEFQSSEIDEQASRYLRSQSDLLPVEGPIQEFDVITANLTVTVDGEQINKIEDVEIDLRPTLSFRDAKIEGLDALLLGKEAGEKVKTEAKFSDSATRQEVRGKTADVEIEVLDVKRAEHSELTEDTYQVFGDGFGNVGEVRDAIKSEMERQLEYSQSKKIREQISGLLTESANWELPPELLERQSRREMERAILELRRNGFNENYIAAFENDLRQNSQERTAVALKEHFILERIAEEEGIEDEAGDYDKEIALIAMSMQDSPRRVRARLERSGQMDTLRNQIIERKVIDLIKENATFKGTDFDLNKDDVAAFSVNLAGKSGGDIPEAKTDYVEPTNASGTGDHVAPRSGR